MPEPDVPSPRPLLRLAGDVAIPSELTRGPWDEGSQHAGPPAALLGRALEWLPVENGTPMRIGRVTYEDLRPVPIAPLRVEAEIERDGRRVQMLGASLFADDEEVMRARAWRLREEAVELPGGLAGDPPEHGPADGEDAPFFPTERDGYHTAVEYGSSRAASSSPARRSSGCAPGCRWSPGRRSRRSSACWWWPTRATA